MFWPGQEKKFQKIFTSVYLVFWPGQEKKSFKKNFYKCLFSVLAWTGKKVSKNFTSVYLVFWPGQGKKFQKFLQVFI